MKKRFLYILVILLASIFVSLILLNRINKKEIKSHIDRISFAEGITIKNLIEVSGRHFMEKGESDLKGFLNSLFKNQAIVYIGLFKGNQLLYLLSRFEGYFPVVDSQQEISIIDSPIDKIFNIQSTFGNDNSNPYSLNIGYKYSVFSIIEKASRRNFLLVSAVFTLIVLVISVFIFYSDKKFYLKELELEMEKQEKEHFKDLSLITSEIAHEIKNPLNSIYLSFGALEKYLCVADNNDAIFYRDAIKDEIKRISGIISSYSDLSKDIKPQIESTDISQLINEIKVINDKFLAENKAELEVVFSGERNVKTDGNLLKQIFFNLINNAIEAESSKILITISVNRQSLIMSVKDNGTGISTETAKNIFKPYVSSKTKGMGLGLYIVYRIINALKGKIRLASHQPGNTEFLMIFSKGD